MEQGGGYIAFKAIQVSANLLHQAEICSASGQLQSNM
jgi:hypothetical protein